MSKKPQPQFGSAKGMMEIADPSPASPEEMGFPSQADLSSLSAERLREELARGLTLTRLGLVWAELERRGEDLSDLRHGLARTLPLIASRRLAAAAVVAFAGRPSVLRAIEGLPLDEQIALANGRAIPVIDPADASAVQQMSLERLPSAALRLVFGEGEIRTPEAQRLALRPRHRPMRREENERRWQPIYDPESGTVRIGRMCVRVPDIISALASAAGQDRPPASDRPDDYLTLKTRLTREEHDRFLALCKRYELPEWEMIRKALRAFGLI